MVKLAADRRKIHPTLPDDRFESSFDIGPEHIQLFIRKRPHRTLEHSGDSAHLNRERKAIIPELRLPAV